MNPIKIDYYFSTISPWTYLGDQRFQTLVQKYNAEVTYHPLSSPDLFPATGGALLKDRAQPRKDYRLVELERWRDHLGVPLNVTPKHFPVPEGPASKLILAAQEAGENPGPLLSAILRAVWADEQNASDPQVLIGLGNDVGLNGQALWDACQNARFDTMFKETTDMAISRGVFGYPTYVINGELFWGQDRLDFVEQTLGRLKIA